MRTKSGSRTAASTASRKGRQLGMLLQRVRPALRREFDPPAVAVDRPGEDRHRTGRESDAGASVSANASSSIRASPPRSRWWT